MRTTPISDRLPDGLARHSVRAIPAPLCDLGFVKTLRAYRLGWLLAPLLAAGSFSLCAQTNDPGTNPPTTAVVATNATIASTTNPTAVVAEPVQSPAPEIKPVPAPAPGKLDFSSFKLVSDRNIFNGNRSGQRLTATRASTQQRSVRVESFSLVGTLLAEDKVPVAFFDGTSSELRKSLKAGGSIAGFTVQEILHAGVRLVEGTNTLDVLVGSGLRREDEGLWKSSTSSASYASSSSGNNSGGTSARARTDTGNNNSSARSSGRNNGGGRNGSTGSSPSSDSPPTAEVNEVLKKLMEKREKE